jgi:hypothetical protein
MVVLIIGLILQCSPEHAIYEPFERSGALVVIIGVLIESQHVLRIVGNHVYSGAEELTVGKAPEAQNLSEFLSLFSSHVGLLWILIGTFIWGFGGLISIYIK